MCVDVAEGAVSAAEATRTQRYSAEDKMTYQTYPPIHILGSGSGETQNPIAICPSDAVRFWLCASMATWPCCGRPSRGVGTLLESADRGARGFLVVGLKLKCVKFDTQVISAHEFRGTK